MSDQNNSFYDFLRALYPAVGIAGASSAYVGVKYIFDWIKDRNKDKQSEEEKEDAARQKMVDALDTRTRAMLDRVERDNQNLHEKMDFKDAEMQEMRDHALDLRSLVFDARQVAENAARAAGIPAPTWRDIPRLEPRRRT